MTGGPGMMRRDATPGEYAAILSSMVWSMKAPPLRARVRAAVDRGLDALEAQVRPDGSWPSRMYANLHLDGPAQEEAAPFVAALGAVTLEACDDPRTRAIRDRTEAYVARSMSHPGVWRYWADLPNDADSLSLCSQVIPWHPWVLLGRNLRPLRMARDDRGRFRTWLLAPRSGEPAGAVGAVDDHVDSVVNANVVGYLALQGQHALGAAAAAWLAGTVTEGTGAGSSHYYPDPLDLYDAMARARQRGVPAFQDLGPLLAARIRARRGADGSYGDTLRTARSLCALHLLGAAPEGGDLRATLERIMAPQQADGGWPEHLFWQGPLPPRPPSVGFACALLDTASCVEALVRSTAAIGLSPRPTRTRPQPDRRAGAGGGGCG